jgi:D-glycero-D-manno-heptose 1,7-bisphosphate phosphatase
MTRFVFLDRDGTLVRDVGYPHRLEDYELLPGVAAGLRRLAAAGFRLAIVTNQSGIGRGLFTHREFEAFHARLLEDLTSARIRIERTFVCPHPPDAGCGCRKPEPGLLWRARDELQARLEASWVIGDSEADIELAQRAGCRGAVRLLADTVDSPPRQDDVLVAANLEQAADAILATEGLAHKPV